MGGIQRLERSKRTPEGRLLQRRVERLARGQAADFDEQAHELSYSGKSGESNALGLEKRPRLAPPEVFHEMLEHRWYLSEQAGHDVGTTAATRSYFETVLPRVPEPLATGEVTADL